MRTSALEPGPRRAGAVLAVLALAMIAVGCSSPDEPARPIDVAQQKLEASISDHTWVAGFSISQNSVSVVSGTPVRKHYLYSVGGEAGIRTGPAHPTQMVRGADFPVEASVDRARKLAAQCDGWGMVDVWALTETAVVTRASCKPDGETHHTVLLNDQILPAIDDPISAATITTVWSEIAAAGLDEHLLRVEIDRRADQASVFFAGFDRDLTYAWIRGLTEPNSLVVSHPIQPTSTPHSLGSVPAEQVTAALEQALAGLDDQDSVERIAVEPTKDGQGLQLELTGLDYTPLATVPIDA